jgi:tetratricopeptide (TPR) repeat protein
MIGALQRWLDKLQDRRDPRAAPREPEAPASPDVQQGNAALAAGDLAAAAGHFRAAIAARPQDAAARANLGYVLLEQGDAAGAEPQLAAAVALGGGPDAHFMLGHALALQQRWDEARREHETAVTLQPAFGFAWRGLGMAREHLGDLAGALDAYEQAVHHAPQLVDALGACARLQSQLGRDEQAVATANAWAAAAPGEWTAPFVLGQSLHALQRHEEALAALERALALAPGNAAALHARGNVLFALGRFAPAECSFADAHAAEPGWLEPQVNHGVVLDRLGRHEEALARFEQVLARDANHPLALYWRPVTLLSLGRVDDALEAVAGARAARPGDADMEWHYGFTHLLAGRMREGWPAYEARWRARSTGASLARAPFAQPLWTGQALEGKTLLLHPEQGLGDILQFIRFVPVLEQRGARVLVWSPGSLESLLRSVSPRVQTSSRLEDLPAFDYHCPIMSMPLALGTTLDDLPGPVPYLRADAQRQREWAGRLGPRRGMRVGVVWSGNPAQPNDRNRSMPLATFAKLAAPGCEFVALQNVMRPEDEGAWDDLRFFGNELRSFEDTAALAANMDLVVSVCTSGAHLAGALGLPLWVLLAYRADWRWLLDREDSPWYPTARLFRQDTTRDWDAVISRVREALAARAASFTPPASA